MRKFELFCLIFYALDALWDKSKSDELGNYLSNANPFLFKDIGSANPEIYESFCKNMPDYIPVEGSYTLAIHYIDTLHSSFIANEFQKIGNRKWEQCAREFLSSPHKEGVLFSFGQDVISDQIPAGN